MSDVAPRPADHLPAPQDARPGSRHGTEPGTEPGARTGRRALDAADLARVATFAALLAVLGQPGALTLLGNAVPITLQTLGVMLAGALLGARRAALSVLVLLGLAAAGLPVLAGGRGGLGAFVGPTAGYLLGFVAGAAVVGLLVDRLLARTGRVNVLGVLGASLVGGVAVVYACGLPVQSLVTGVPLAEVARLSLVFVPGDVLKAVVCAVVTVAVVRAYPAALAGRRGAR